MKTEDWNKYHGYGLFFASIIFIINHSIVPFITISFISFGLLWFMNWKEIRQIYGGFANWTTAIRYIGLILICFIYLIFTN
jgi:hypothetical protein